VNEPRLLTKAQAAAYCELTPSAFGGWVRRGLLPPALKGTQRWDKRAIDRWLDRLSGIEQADAPKGSGPSAADFLKRYDQDDASH
jgi:hypothetical protein